jgi:8-oxo-dGTP pyrophosphatase MutT (NUDIX family)/uncharacterized protein YqfB (UPF0267 family)
MLDIGMAEYDKDQYFVAVKLFLEDGKGNFLITKDRFGDWDIPGGRLREADFAIPLAKIAARKVKEELGEDLQYVLSEPIVFMRHERDEILPSGDRQKRRIFAIGYRADVIGGDIVLGKNHKVMEWVRIADFLPEERFSGGWLNGVREYLDTRRRQGWTKTIKFTHMLAKDILAGVKHSTIRLFDDKNISEGDIVMLLDKEAKSRLGLAKIASILEKPLGSISDADLDGHAKYSDQERMLADFCKYYGDEVTLETPVKIIRFNFPIDNCNEV